jgi:voltage-gated potassium channel
VGKKLSEANLKKKYNVMVIAVSREDGELIYNPSSDVVFQQNDKIMVIGPAKKLAELNEAI